VAAAPEHRRSRSRLPPPPRRQRPARDGQRRSGAHARGVSALAAARAQRCRVAAPNRQAEPPPRAEPPRRASVCAPLLKQRAQLRRRPPKRRPLALRSGWPAALPTRLVGCTRQGRDDHHRLWSPRRGPPQRSRYLCNRVGTVLYRQTDSRPQVADQTQCTAYLQFVKCAPALHALGIGPSAGAVGCSPVSRLPR